MNSPQPRRNLLSEEKLKLWLQKAGLTRADKVLLVLASFGKPESPANIKLRARRSGCKMDNWNISDIINRADGIALKLPSGYEIAEKGHARLQHLGLNRLSPAAAKVAVDLRKHLTNIKDPDTRAFVEEAIKCYESELYRSAIVMSWLAAVGVLQNEVVKNHLAAFNTAAKAIDPKWKLAQNTDDFGRIKEADFLDRIAGISMIGKNVKDELVKALKLRNGCGHPNSLKVSANITAGHIELLLLNVFDKFCI